MEKIRIGYDDNLGLPSDFSESLGFEEVPYHDLGKMIAEFESKNLYAMFVPAGTLPYLKGYEIIAQALFGSQNKMTLQTNFVSLKNLSISEITDLEIGRVNQYCTTSFWAPLIYLKQFLPEKMVLTFKDTKSFTDMLHKTAEGIVDCSMVWDIILRQHPDDASKVQEAFSKDDLPTPVIVSKEKDSAVAKKISEFKTKDTKAFFKGFQLPDINSVNQFVSAMKAVSQYFRIKIDD